MDETHGIYCARCVEANIEAGITDRESCDLLLPYAGIEVCAECGDRVATLREPDWDEEVAR